ncbi:Plant lipid transfer protein/Par allergen [Corchorus olitorius]|uniref:Non-specific lipid-transfer protein n=1 Tax=Corchorus olitorius TaxID=93759 RepID=A0A1R3KGC7_9ROSI|nr:Plant lipid transfer protein/Par allergen [Corchorus olitorius]
MSRISSLTDTKLIICTLFVLIGFMDAAVTCPQVSNALVPCVTYMATRSSFGHCCTGIKQLNAGAKTTSDRQNICRCLRSLAGQFVRRHRLDFNLAKKLPAMCNVNIRYSITTLNPDCSK